MDRKKVPAVGKGQIENAYNGLALAALFNGALACVAVLSGSWSMATILYLVATFARIAAGWMMNLMGDADTVNAWNNKYHRKLVIVLNGVVGSVLLGRLVYDWFVHRTHGGALVFLALIFAAYFIAAKFTRPNTFAARVRSATLTIVLLETMAYLAFGVQYCTLYLLGGVLAWLIAWVRLAQLADRFKWAE